MISKAVPKRDGLLLACGAPMFLCDITFGREALCVRLVRSPHAFARIRSIDAAAAKKVPGVVCVLTYLDVPKTRYTTAGENFPEQSPYDRLILGDVARYVGDPVAIVAAKSVKAAQRAARLVRVDYEVLEPVLDPHTAAGNKSVIHEEDDIRTNYDIGIDAARNVISACGFDQGEIKLCDALDGAARDDLDFCETYASQAQCHSMMETHRAFSFLDGDGRLTVVSSSQSPFNVRKSVAKSLDLPIERVRILKPRVGGGFGGKNVAAVDAYPALVTLKTGLPAQLVLDRRECQSCTTTRHAMEFDVRMKADANGQIGCLDIGALMDGGAYGDHSPAVLKVAGFNTLPVYGKIPVRHFGGLAVYTNKVPGGALRGYGTTQSVFALESAVSELAARLRTDPIELRLKNIARTEENSGLVACIEKVRRLSRWDERPHRLVTGPHTVRGMGMAVAMHGSGIANADVANAQLRLEADGTYALSAGNADIGTGSDVTMPQIACEILGAPLDSVTLCNRFEADGVRVVGIDTDRSPFDTGAYASSTTYITGSAVSRAATDLRGKMLRAAAALLGAREDAVEFDGKVFCAGGKSVTLPDFARHAAGLFGGVGLVGHGIFCPDYSPNPYIAGVAEVEVDTETGKVTPVLFTAVVDCGTVINSNMARIQTEGGLVQGIGLALYEDILYSRAGRMMTDTFLQYKIPSRRDVGDISVDFAPSYVKKGPLGAKSIGEIVCHTPAPAIAAAVAAAVGVHIRTLPITPQKVLAALTKKREAEENPKSDHA